MLLTPILMNALAVHIALRMKIWNIGSEGQFFMGAWAAAGIGIHWGGPRYLVLFVMALVAAVAGAVWILVPALARAHWQVNEIITTLLLNFVAIQWVAWFSFDIWRDKAAAVVQSTPVVQGEAAVLPGLEHALRRPLRPVDHRRRDVRRVPLHPVGLRDRHDRRQPARRRVRRHPRDEAHRHRDAALRRHRRLSRACSTWPDRPSA